MKNGEHDRINKIFKRMDDLFDTALLLYEEGKTGASSIFLWQLLVLCANLISDETLTCRGDIKHELDLLIQKCRTKDLWPLDSLVKIKSFSDDPDEYAERQEIESKYSRYLISAQKMLQGIKRVLFPKHSWYRRPLIIFNIVVIASIIAAILFFVQLVYDRYYGGILFNQTNSIMYQIQDLKVYEYTEAGKRHSPQGFDKRKREWIVTSTPWGHLSRIYQSKNGAYRTGLWIVPPSDPKSKYVIVRKNLIFGDTLYGFVGVEDSGANGSRMSNISSPLYFEMAINEKLVDKISVDRNADWQEFKFDIRNYIKNGKGELKIYISAENYSWAHLMFDVWSDPK